jgi:4'-phosphopantetheinyl transferase
MVHKNKTDAIYPVIRSVPGEVRLLTVREKRDCLSRYARNALKISAEKIGWNLKSPECLLKDENGAPVPAGDYYWSVTHKSEYVGAVAGTARMGIDIEKIRTCSERLFRKIADEKEWALTDAEPFERFFRYWTSKEAVLKAVGTGLKGLSICRIREVADHLNLTVEYKNQSWLTEHIFFDGHLASVVKYPCNSVYWTILHNI